MVTKSLLVLSLAALALAIAPARAESPAYKMTTDVPANTITPDKAETRLGTLEYFDGIPTDETAQKVWDHLDFSRAVEAMITHVPTASLVGFRKGLREFGPDNETMIIFEGRLDPRALLLTGNTTVVYSFMWIDLKDGPMVMETPPNVLGIVDDAWFRYLTDFGNAGDDKGEGGKYLLVGPDYEGDIPDGYIVKKSKTYGHWLAMRGFMKNFDADPVVTNMKEHFKLYPLGSEPKDVNWVNVSGKAFNTLHAQDETFFEEVNEIVQEEPYFSYDNESIGMLAAIGIEKGKPFAPDARMQKILKEAAAVGTAAMRSIVFNNRDETVRPYPNSKTWEVGFAGGSHEFLRNDASLSDYRARFHFYATGITPAMVNPGVGRGSQYMIGAHDSEGSPFDGAQTYTMHVPPDVPAANFWDVTLYDNQTRSLMQTDQNYPGVSSIDEAIVKNADGSYDITFSPEKPEGDVNWLQTIPGKGWNILWRIYSPTQPWFDKAWQPGEVVQVE
ncbi:DUF1254 domain-containing protein [Labrenzia sp. 011]|uniref:DUF1254 domain-containing protein n=1 Tax=Labrenzia sp. 011 TaxID=2171494 RepID=UPI000D51BF13|nr:DUF1254 domain-containing protein [Labrenzia sp. 011]PVB59849.1 hypothetical protein DCO57_20390 [Labrenzia sp. 011]